MKYCVFVCLRWCACVLVALRLLFGLWVAWLRVCIMLLRAGARRCEMQRARPRAHEFYCPCLCVRVVVCVWVAKSSFARWCLRL